MDLVDRIWAHDASVWTGADEASWLGWLEEPALIRPKVPAIEEFARKAVEDGLTEVLLMGMGGSSLAPEVFRRTFAAESFHMLDTTHPDAVRSLTSRLDLEHTLFLVASKSGTTLETRCHLEYFWDKAGGRAEQFVAITDPGSALEKHALDTGFRTIWEGHPAIGGRYSALSVFGLVPAALMGVDLERLLERTHEMTEACRLPVGNPGLDLGLRLGAGAAEGRDKVLINPTPGGFGSWIEQLIAESTGKDGKGLVPVPGETGEGPDRQNEDVRVSDEYEIGQEFFRWEFATAVAGSLIGINPFDQPDVQAAKDMTTAFLRGESDFGVVDDSSFGSLDELLNSAEPPDYIAIQAFIDPAREDELEPLIARARETGCVVTHGLGPRYLHSTGQLHKGGPATGRFIQVYGPSSEDVNIPGQSFTFGMLIAAQMAGDKMTLEKRGRPVVRIRLEDIS